MTISLTDHVYARRPEGEQLLTVHHDDDVPPRAVLLYFHGGGWQGGSRLVENVTTRLQPLVSHGVIVVSADYRLTGDAVWPAQLEDAGDAFEWTASAYPDLPVFVAGASAGGHLAGLVGLRAWERLTGTSHVRPAAGVITYATVADPYQWDSERRHEPLPLPGTFAHWSYSRHGQWPPGGLGEKLLAGADTRVSPSVYNHVDVEAVPFLIIHGDRDTCVSHQESVQLLDTLSRRGNRAFLLEIAGADHEDPRFDEPFVRGALAAFIDQFADRSSAPLAEEGPAHA
ncbi:MAG: alpha/beta hydrolase [Microbacterium sp.]|uniref:alpha/beta hydrolase fold domain-containing protein n=1 Tax=Microbacterium sp. TaxID=51671 RepID=UPI0039E3EB30